MFKDNRYTVHLPWKTPFPVLPDNYDLSMKRLEHLLKRLGQDPEVAREYDTITKLQQLQRGILQIVEKPCEGEDGNVHCIPHHPVITRDKATIKPRVAYVAFARSTVLL